METDGAFFLCSAITWQLQRRLGWLRECRTVDFNTRNSNLPLCKVQEEDLLPANILLQFCCNGICVKLKWCSGTDFAHKIINGFH